MCAAAERYVWGELGDNWCPQNAVQIRSAEACQRAAAAMGKGWHGSVNSAECLSGCFLNEEDGSASFNAHPVGSGYPDNRPLCAVGTVAPLALALPAAIAQRTSSAHRHGRAPIAARAGFNIIRRCTVASPT
jgi:hypothetical protein